MKKSLLIAALTLTLLLPAGCSAPGAGEPQPGGTPTSGVPVESKIPAEGETTQPAAALMTLRIVDGADTLDLLLAEQGESGGVYRLDLNALALPQTGLVLEDGMVVEVGYEGPVLETFPARFANVVSLSATEEETSDLSGLYLQVLSDLWAEDPGLNEGITQLGVNLSELEGLNKAEKAALAYAFGMEHGIMPVLGTWEELRDRGYFEEVEFGDDTPPDRKLYQWEDGCLFTLEGSASAFSAQKWRSPLGAYYFEDCKVQESADGWSYTVGSKAIS